MTSEPMLLDPEVEELLREVAADPDSTLLRVPRGKAVRALYEQRPIASSQRSTLSIPEREIMRVRRLEIAWLLRQACLRMLIEGIHTRAFVSPFVGPGERLVLLDPSELATRCHAAAEAPATDGANTTGLTLLSAVVATPHGSAPSIVDLAAAAHRLHPSADSRILASQDLALRSSPRSALAILRTVLAAPMPERTGVAAWSAVGLAYLALERRDWAHAAYVEASKLDPLRPGPWMDRLTLAIQLGFEADALQAANHLDEVLAANDPVVDWYVGSRLNRRLASDWAPTPAGLRLTASLHDELGPVGRRVCSVFA
ncbi:MAG TPA: hypothetical protein VGR31_13150 [Planctomycetota bacterium]|jgi:hypothetical protein|nr:hypothetical protein [Planctomycetota bacterium]